MTRIEIDPKSIIALRKELRAAGDKAAVSALRKGLNSALKPIQVEVNKQADKVLPAGGGLAKRVTTARWTTKVRGGRRPAVKGEMSQRKKGKSRVTRRSVKGRLDLRSLNAGRLRHPVYGNRRAWVSQRVSKGWFDKGARKGLKASRKLIAAEYKRAFKAASGE